MDLLAINTKNCTAPASGPLHILAVDDHFANLLLTQNLLQRDGHSAELANGGLEGLDKALASHFDLILLDIQMPILGGKEVLHAIRAADGPNQHCPIFALTSYSDRSEATHILDSGFQAVLKKPFRVADMQAKIQELGQRRLPQSLPKAQSHIYDGVSSLPLLENETIKILTGAIEHRALLRIVRIFWDDAGILMAAIKKARLTANIDHCEELIALRRNAHALKGACANVGLLRAARLCQHLQNAPVGSIAYLIELAQHALDDSQAALTAALEQNARAFR